MEKNEFHRLFPGPEPVIGCVHLLPLPGSPRYKGSVNEVLERALKEISIYQNHDIDGIIIENFGDIPFLPGNLQAETIAAMSIIVYESVKAFRGAVGVNVLRNDAYSALSVAHAAGAHFIRVNVHTGVKITDQGMVEGRSYETLRLKKNLGSRALILADAGVKHAVSPGGDDLENEVSDLTRRGMVDGIIITGKSTGKEPGINDLKVARQNTDLPLLTGSGCTPENIGSYAGLADGFIVGSYFKKNGKAENELDETRVAGIMQSIRKVRS